MKELEKIQKQNLLFGLLFLFLALYILTKNTVFAILTALSLIAGVIIEIYVGIKKHGLKKEALETLLTLAIVLFIWYGLQFILSTSTPISAIVSCSMLPSLSRGDLIIVQGADYYKGKIIDVSNEDLAYLNSLSDVFYKDTYIGEIKGSLYSYCSVSQDDWCKDFLSTPQYFTEKKGKFSFYYKLCKRKNIYSNMEWYEPCIHVIEYNGKNITIDKSGDIIVYRPSKSELFGRIGDIVHRVVLVLNASNTYYYLTKGDNNNVLDIQFYSYSLGLGNDVVKKEEILGKVIFNIPYIGYLRLFLSPYLNEGKQCSTHLIY